MNQYWWGNIDKAAESAYLACSMCSKFNPGKPIQTIPGYFHLPNEPSKIWETDFMQSPPLMNVLLMVCIFSHWTEVFHEDM